MVLSCQEDIANVPGKPGTIARNMESGYQVQSWADQALQQKLIKNNGNNMRSIKPIFNKFFFNLL